MEKTRAIKLKIQEKRMTPTSLMYQVYQVLYLQSHKPGFWGYKIVAYPSVGITLSVNHIYTSVSFQFLLSTTCYNAVKTKRKFMIA